MLIASLIARLLEQAEPGSRAQEEALIAVQRIAAHLPLARAATSYVPVLLRILRTQPEHAARVVRLLTTFMAMGSVRWRVHERMTAMAFEAAKLPQGIPHGIPHAHGMRLGPTPPQPTGYALGLDDGFVSHGVGGSSAKLDVRKGKHGSNGTVVGSSGGGESVEPARKGDSLLEYNLLEYERLLPHALEGRHSELLSFLHAEGARHQRPISASRVQPTKLPVKQEAMRRLWETRAQQPFSADDWHDWMRHLCVELLRESPSPALRACAPVAQMHAPLARRLFDVGFMACWGELSPASRESLIASIEAAITAPTTPTEVLLELLALAEYMERRDQQLPLNIRMLGDIATRCGAFSKALHYRELEYQALTASRSSPRLVEALVSLHRSLGQPEAALGVLTYAQQRRQDFTIKVSWLEKLGRWQDALTSYERAQLVDPRAGEFALGRMRCLHALSEWQQLSRVCEAAWPYISNSQQLEASPLLAAARWHSQQWDGLRRVVQLLDPASYTGGFFRALLSVNTACYDEAAQWIRVSRNALHPELGPLENEAYSRVYDQLVKAQQLSELEELLEYKQCQHMLAVANEGHARGARALHQHNAELLARARETCEGIRRRWRTRLHLCARELRVWQPMVELRAMALGAHEHTETWIKFASLCRKAGRLDLTRMSLSKLILPNTGLTTLPVHQLASMSYESILRACTPEVLYAYSKYLWATGAQATAIEMLSRLLAREAHEPPFPHPHQLPLPRASGLNEDDEDDDGEEGDDDEYGEEDEEDGDEVPEPSRLEPPPLLPPQPLHPQPQLAPSQPAERHAIVTTATPSSADRSPADHSSGDACGRLPQPADRSPADHSSGDACGRLPQPADHSVGNASRQPGTIARAASGDPPPQLIIEALAWHEVAAIVQSPAEGDATSGNASAPNSGLPPPALPGPDVTQDSTKLAARCIDETRPTAPPDPGVSPSTAPRHPDTPRPASRRTRASPIDSPAEAAPQVSSTITSTISWSAESKAHMGPLLAHPHPGAHLHAAHLHAAPPRAVQAGLPTLLPPPVPVAPASVPAPAPLGANPRPCPSMAAPRMADAPLQPPQPSSMPLLPPSLKPPSQVPVAEPSAAPGAEPSSSPSSLPSAAPSVAEGTVVADNPAHGEGGGAAEQHQREPKAQESHGHTNEHRMDNRLCRRAYLQLGSWQQQLGQAEGTGLDDETIARVLHSYHLATCYATDSYKAWHAWALMNFTALTKAASNPHAPSGHSGGAAPLPPPAGHAASASTTGRNHAASAVSGSYSSASAVAASGAAGGSASAGQAASARRARHQSASLLAAGGGSELLNERVLGYVVSAMRGFFRSIALGSSDSLQDLLRLLTLWFRYGAEPRVESTLLNGFDAVEIDMWLLVLPQIIARISSPSPRVRACVHKLLLRVGRRHPQALIYPLAVASHEARGLESASGGSSLARGRGAVRILSAMRSHCDTLVEQALLVSTELIRVAILWGEMWYGALEQAYRRYFFTENQGVDAMLAVLQPLAQKLDEGALTANERAFVSAYGPDLSAALAHCREFSLGGAESLLQAAWERFYAVLRQLGRELQETRSLQLEQVSPELLRAHHLELAVPGTYHASREVIAIERFAPSIKVMNSKQRPRRLAVFGSDGIEYGFLLKGHEDLRQDERVMQLFGLVNTLLGSTEDCARLDLGIHRYSVVPLSTNSGLIEWVPQCDTLHALVRDYRVPRSILLNVEHRLMLHFAPDLDNLTLLQKVEVFKHALAHTGGMDLYRVLWMKAPSSEAWLERRTNFSRSLAVMSMVGYMLGLGDRHPSNLMLHRFTGKILHIDFGDCFEVAMRRERFPETVPFRLTRMLVNAMEVSGVEGTFRSTCERVMGVLRSHRDSLMAMLEAFIHDPLIKWRLLQPEHPSERSRSRATSCAASCTASGLAGGVAGGVAAAGTAAGGSSSGATRANALLRSRRQSLAPSLRQSLEESFGYNSADPLQMSLQGQLSLQGPLTPHDTMRVRRSMAAAQSSQLLDTIALEGSFEPEALNERAVRVIRRVDNKLTGREFGEEHTVSQQVQRLIEAATSHQNLSKLFVGWCPFW